MPSPARTSTSPDIDVALAGLNPDAEGEGVAITGASVEDVDKAAHAIHVDEVVPEEPVRRG